MLLHQVEAGEGGEFHKKIFGERASFHSGCHTQISMKQ